MSNFVMTSILQAHQLAVWVARKYLRFLVLGALSSCALLNLALHAGAGLQYYCQDECLAASLKSPLSSMDRDVVQHIKDFWVDNGSPKGTYKPPFPIENPPWSNMGNWGEAYKFINNYFKNYHDPGTFMEIGAQDGEFMSLSLYMEHTLGFRGVLVEPNPRDYAKLIAKGRTADSVNACATPGASHRREKLWLRDTPDNLPPILQRIQEGSNRLLQYVSLEDRELGRSVEVQCFNAAAIGMAALGTTTVDMLSISTHGGELDILDAIPKRFRFRMLVLMIPLSTPEEAASLKEMGAKRGLVSVFDKYNVHILIPKNEVKVV